MLMQALQNDPEMMDMYLAKLGVAQSGSQGRSHEGSKEGVGRLKELLGEDFHVSETAMGCRVYHGDFGDFGVSVSYMTGDPELVLVKMDGPGDLSGDLFYREEWGYDDVCRFFDEQEVVEELQRLVGLAKE